MKRRVLPFGSTFTRFLVPRDSPLNPRIRRVPAGRRGGASSALAVVVLCVLGSFVLTAGARSDRSVGAGAPSALLGAAIQNGPTGNVRVRFSMCGSTRHTCVVDGDTIWLDGQNLRLRSFDTPEPYTDICGGKAEVTLAKKASKRLLELLNQNAFTVETFGPDGTGKRTLATIRIGGRDVGDILIEERLARRWPDGNEWWCP